MKKTLTVGLLLLAVVGLTGCADHEDRETQSERYDRLYAECLAAGGSFEYNGSLPYWKCTMPGGEPE